MLPFVQILIITKVLVVLILFFLVQVLIVLMLWLLRLVLIFLLFMTLLIIIILIIHMFVLVVLVVLLLIVLVFMGILLPVLVIVIIFVVVPKAHNYTNDFMDIFLHSFHPYSEHTMTSNSLFSYYCFDIFTKLVLHALIITNLSSFVSLIVHIVFYISE